MNKKLRLTILFIVIVSLLSTLYFFINPATSYLMPKCLFKMLIGYDCPSCGGQRVVYMLLHGNIKDAFLLNPFLFAVIPYLLIVLYTAVSQSRLATIVKPFASHYITISAYIIIYLLWWIVRNTEWWHNLSQI